MIDRVEARAYELSDRRHEALVNHHSAINDLLGGASYSPFTVAASEARGSVGAAFRSGLGTGGKAIGNAGASALSLGFYEGPFGVTQQDVYNGYGAARGIAGVSAELLVGLGTGGLSRLGAIGKGALALDTASNAVGVGRGAYDASQNGLGWANTLQVVGGAAGLGGNLAAGGGALRELASDAGRVRVESFGFAVNPIPKRIISPISEFDVRQYSDFAKFPGDGLEGHEILQAAVLRRNGWHGHRPANPSLALAERPGLHGVVTDLQRQAGLHTESYLNSTTRARNIKDNIDVLRHAVIPEATIQNARRVAVLFARGLPK